MDAPRCRHQAARRATRAEGGPHVDPPESDVDGGARRAPPPGVARPSAARAAGQGSDRRRRAGSPGELGGEGRGRRPRPVALLPAAAGFVPTAGAGAVVARRRAVTRSNALIVFGVAAALALLVVTAALDQQRERAGPVSW